jgi:hypothetical protein
MQTLGVIALVLGLASLIAGLISFALNRAAPRSDEQTPTAGEADRDLPTIDDEDVRTGMEHHPGATGVRDAGQATATPIVRN